MKPYVIFFLVVASIFAILSILYVIGDLIWELCKKKKKQEEPEEEQEEVQPVEEPPVQAEDVPLATAPIIPEIVEHIVEHIDAQEANEIISDDIAMSAAIVQEGAGEGYKTYINLGDVDKHFNAGDTVTLAALKEKGLIERKAQRIKILADGVLTKPLTVKAESFSIEAIKMIELTGGTVIILK